MSPEQLSHARHMLGLPNQRKRSYRNHFATHEGGADHAVLVSMSKAGLALRTIKPKHFGGADLFHLTLTGAESALLPGETLDEEDFPHPNEEAVRKENG